MFLLAGSACASDAAYRTARAQQEASIAKQLAAARVQEAAAAARNPAFFTAAALVAAEQSACDRIPLAKVSGIVDEGARRAGLDTALVRAVVRKESAFDSCATSVKGAQGLMQLMPSVQMQFGVNDPYDPGQNVAAGTRLLKQLLEMYSGDLPRALGAYNAGPAQVEKWGGVPQIPETQKYVESILGEIK